LKKTFWSIAENFLKFSNFLSEVRLDVSESTSFLLSEKFSWISVFCSSGARTKAYVTKCEHDLESSCYALQNSIKTASIACTSQEI
jgi:hypothetical protein